MAHREFVIIGNGIAGNNAASAIRKYDREAEITLISEEREPLYSPCAFHKYLAGEIAFERLYLKRMEDYAMQGIRTILGQKAIDVDVKGQEIRTPDNIFRYDKMILATGGLGLLPRIKGLEKIGVFALKKLQDVQSVSGFEAKRATVIGSGPIGVEAAVALRKKGLEVSLIEIMDRVLPRIFDEKPASILGEILCDQGIQVSTGEKVLEILGREYVQGVATDKREISCDMVVMGAGVRPNVDLAKKMGCEIGSLGGIKTNEFLMTSLQDIYACGDCIESKDIFTGENTLSLLWPNAKRQGWISGCNCAGEQRRYIGSFNATSLELLGQLAVSAGRTSEGFTNTRFYKSIEKVQGSAYHKMIFSQDKLVGLQLINCPEYAGLLISRIMRGDHVLDLAKVFRNDRRLSKSPWNYWIGQYFADNLLGKKNQAARES